MTELTDPRSHNITRVITNVDTRYLQKLRSTSAHVHERDAVSSGIPERLLARLEAIRTASELCGVALLIGPDAAAATDVRTT